jgi:hypothetical protein
MTSPAVRFATYPATRLQIPVTEPIRDFQAHYEKAVPALDAARVQLMVERRAPWTEMLDYIAGAAPFGFLIYWKNPASQLMRLAGDSAPCTAYLMGNHTTAERMFRHNPAAMLYAPLRTVLWEEPDGRRWFAADQPSAQFASFADPAITTVGDELDAKLAVLLDHLGLEVPASLRAPAATRPA